MGPEGGAKGGKIIAEGSVKEVAKNHAKTGSYTGKFLAEELEAIEKLGKEGEEKNKRRYEICGSKFAI